MELFTPMTKEELTTEISTTLGFEPTADQWKATQVFADFMFHRSAMSAMVMKGSAGTGKTSLASAIVKTMKRLGQRVMLLAPTGRAAKVFALNSDSAAYTIHRKIYRQKSFSGLDTGFSLNDNIHQHTLFIVDEASMISNQSSASFEGGMFGNNGLLEDLVKFVYSGNNCHLMLIGDAAQLPPVGAIESPALDERELGCYGLEVFSSSLNEVLRQSQDSGILYNATVIRRMITHDEMTQLPRIRLACFADVEVVTGNDLIDMLSSSYSNVGLDDTMVICRSNKRCNIYNQGIRNRILEYEEELSSRDQLMIVKNNYHWTELEVQALKKAKEPTEGVPPFLANGDMCIVRRVRNVEELYGLRFADATLRFPDYDDYELEVKVLLDCLSSDSPALTREQQEKLFQGVYDDYFDIPLKADKMKAVRGDVYYNALQIKYAYAITCHKAQGGQWAHIYLDQGYMTDDMLNPDYIHWLYTAFTRAREKLYLVNWPKTQVEPLP